MYIIAQIFISQGDSYIIPISIDPAIEYFLGTSIYKHPFVLTFLVFLGIIFILFILFQIAVLANTKSRHWYFRSFADDQFLAHQIVVLEEISNDDIDRRKKITKLGEKITQILH